MVSNPLVFLYNTLVILLTLSIAFLTKRRVFTTALISILWISFGITNFIVLSNRVTPFTATDFALLGDGTTILTKYFNSFQIILVGIAVLLIIAGLVFAWLRAPKYEKPISYLKNTAIIAAISLVLLFSTKLGLSTNVLAANFGNIADAYKDYGFVYCFTNSLVNTGMSKPKDYSPDAIDKIANENLATSKYDDPNGVKKPNIVMVQLESFFDPTTLKGVEFSEDPIPNFHKYSSEFTSGNLTVPSIGAGTANTEFEVITGMNLDFFGPGEYPYKTILKETTAESIPYNLKDLGYSTHAIHNNDGCFYGRHKVFANLGFDTFTSVEYMNPIPLNPTGWAKDEILVKEIINSLNSTPNQQDYVYTISVQGHGKYPNNPDGDLQSTDTSDEVTTAAEAEAAIVETPTDATTDQAVVVEDETNVNKKPTKEERLKEYSSSPDYIKVDGFNEEKDYAFEYYVNQIHEMDAFVGNLINELSNLGEDVVLVLFGDHLPTFGLEEDDLEVNTLYDTPYLIWDNIGLKKSDKNLESYQLASFVLDQLNIHNGTLTKLHQNDSDKENYLETFEMLQYDMLYGKREIYGEENPYEPTDMKMGIFDAQLFDVIEEEDRILITGEYFTEYSEVIINGELVDTTYISDKEVSIEKQELKEGDVISVGQVDGTYVLSSTNEYIYKAK